MFIRSDEVTYLHALVMLFLPNQAIAAEAFAQKKLLGEYGFLAAVYSYVK
jgi:hypothetical protein